MLSARAPNPLTPDEGPRRAVTTFLGDMVEEHSLFVDFALTFPRNEPVRIERTSGTRDELKQTLAARGVYVLEEDEPLALAHREVKKAREVLERHSPGRQGSGW